MGRPSLRSAVGGFQRSREPRRAVWSGWMINYEGRSDNSAKVTDEDGKVYVVLDQGAGTASGEVIQAWCDFRPVPGWAVLVGTRRDKPNDYSVLDIDGYAMGGKIDGMAKLGWHSEMHEWGHPTGSDDVVYSRWLQLYDFGVWPGPTGGLDVQDGVFNPSGTKIGFELSNVDFSLFTPSGSGSRWVLVCLTPTGTIELWPGPIVYGRFLEFVDIPAAPVDNWWELAAVRLNYDTTTVIMRPDNENIVDLRLARVGWPQLKAGGTTGSGSCDIELSPDLDNNLLELSDVGGTYTFDLDSQPSGTVFAAPLVADGKPSFRFLADSDVPDIHAHYPGTVELGDLARGGAAEGEALTWSGGWGPDMLPNWENVLLVAKSGADYTTVQSAVDAAVDGDVVYIMPGTYVENVSIGNKEIALVGLDRELCIIQGQMTITTASPDEPRLYNLTLYYTAPGTLLTTTHNNILYLERCTINLTTSTAGNAIAIDNQGAGNLYLRRCYIVAAATGASGDAIGYKQAGTGKNSYLHRCYFIVSGRDDATNVQADGVGQGVYVSYCRLEGVAFTGTYYDFESLNSASITVAFCEYNTGAVVGSITLNDAQEIAASLVTTTLPSNWDAGSVEIRASTFESDVATGTAPFTVASTTKVANLNVEQVDGADASATPAANQIPILSAGGDLLLPSGGDILVEGLTDVDSGLGNIMAGIIGKVSIGYKVREQTFWPDITPPSWGYFAKDATWESWAEGEDAGSYSGSDDFLVDNYNGGNSMWTNYSAGAAPYSVGVRQHSLFLQVKGSGDADFSHGCIVTDLNSDSRMTVQARISRIYSTYSNAGGGNDFYLLIGCFEDDWLNGAALIYKFPLTSIASTGGHDVVVSLATYSHGATTWDPDATTSATFTTNWTTAWTKTFRMVHPFSFANYWYSDINRVYYGIGEWNYDYFDYLSATQNCSTYDKGVICVGYSGVTGRNYALIDYVRFFNV